MVLGWRKAFCTSIPKDEEPDHHSHSTATTTPSPKLTSRFTGFFSNPTTPQTHRTSSSSSPKLRCRTPPSNASVPSNSAPHSPILHCKTRDTPKLSHRSSPSSPRSPSPFSLLKSSLRISKQSRCGVCLQRVKAGQGTAIFTAECGDCFHFTCVRAHVTKHGTLTCPVCNSTWNDMHLLHKNHHGRSSGHVLKVYNDDEPLLSPASGARFNTIPESDETEEENELEFNGFGRNGVSSEMKMREMEVDLLPEAAVVSVGKRSETYAVVLRIRAPPAAAARSPIDLVAVLDVGRGVAGEKLRLMKKAMRSVVSSLFAADRMSIVAFSAASKRLLPLRRMTTAGRRSARRIIDAVVALDGAATAASAADSVKKASKVIEDRREKNPAASVVVFSDGRRGGPLVSSTRLPELDIPIHSVSLSACLNAPDDDSFARSVIGLLSVVIEDLKFQLGFKAGSSPAEISAIYSRADKPELIGSGSSWCRVGDLHPKEEREFMIELKVPSSFGGAQKRQLSIFCSYKDPSTQQPVYDNARTLAIPHPRAVGSSTRDAQRLRCIFVTTRAIVESRRLVERCDVVGAHHMLASARSLILQTGSDVELVRRLEVELAELSKKRKAQAQMPRRREAVQVEEKAEPLTPSSAWRAAERLAKVAIMRKSLNRVSDLHGFENAGF